MKLPEWLKKLVEIPTWDWFRLPSGGPIQPGFWGWLDGVKRRPLVAHPVGAAVVVSVFIGLLHSSPLTATSAALLAEGTNQFYKAIRGVYGNSLWKNVIWRMLLALVGSLAVVLLFHLLGWRL